MHNPLIQTIARSWRMLWSRKLYVAAMIVVPLGCALFLLNLMQEGLPSRVPVAIVDLDRTDMSRQVCRALEANEMTGVEYKLDSYHDAIDKVRNGEIFGFFEIPRDFQRDALANKEPTITYYSNMTFYVPGTLSFKGFKTVAVTASGGLVMTTLTSVGANPDEVGSLLQPVVVDFHPIGNPWLNYSIYLSNSFIPGVVALMVMLVTVFSICEEIKRGTSVEWLRTSGGSMLVGLFGKLLPQTIIFSAVGIACQALLYGFSHFPMHNHAMHIISAMVLMVIACQALAIIICSILPNLRLALSITALIGILSFSITGFSFPVQNMYGGVAIFSYIIPLRWYFLIYIDQALNGIPIYYSRWFYIILLVFPLVSLLGLRRLKRRCLNPVYVP